MSDHHTAARKALGYIPDARDEMRHAALASEATAHALLAIEARLCELIEQQRLANVLSPSESGPPMSTTCSQPRTGFAPESATSSSRIRTGGCLRDDYDHLRAARS